MKLQCQQCLISIYFFVISNYVAVADSDRAGTLWKRFQNITENNTTKPTTSTKTSLTSTSESNIIIIYPVAIHVASKSVPTTTATDFDEGGNERFAIGEYTETTSTTLETTNDLTSTMIAIAATTNATQRNLNHSNNQQHNGFTNRPITTINTATKVELFNRRTTPTVTNKPDLTNNKRHTTMRHTTTKRPVVTNCVELKKCVQQVAKTPDCACPPGGEGNVEWFNGCLVSNGMVDRCAAERSLYVCFNYDSQKCANKQEACYDRYTTYSNSLITNGCLPTTTNFRFYAKGTAKDDKALEACNKLIPS